MELEKVTRLLDAGFTAEEIRQMMPPQTEPQEEPKQEPQEEPKQEPQEQPKQEPDETGKRLDAIENSIASLLKSIQQQNVKKDTMLGASDQKTMQQLTDAAMESIINPLRKEK